MTGARLLIRKGIVNIQGKNRPCIQVQADVGEEMRAVLTEHFLNENLFKRSSYTQGFPQGAPIPPPSLAPHLGNLIKNDACPEITVKTILSGQLHQCHSLWEVMAFEYIAKRAFDGLADLMSCVVELQTETIYVPGANATAAADLAAYVADTAAELADTVASAVQANAA